MGEELQGIVVLDVVRQFAGEVELSGDSLVVATPPQQWNYAVALPVRHEALPTSGKGRPAMFRIEVLVHRGRLGVACANSDMSAFLDQVTIEAGAEPLVVDLSVHDIDACGSLVLRNDWDAGAPSLATVLSVKTLRLPSADQERLYAFYDLNWMPLSFDLVVFLMDAELHRVRAGLSHLHPVLVLGEMERSPRVDDAQERAVDRHSRRWRVHHLLLPILSLFPSVRGFRLIETHDEAMALLSNAPHVYPRKDEVGKRDIAAIFRSFMAHLPGEARCLRPRASTQGLRYAQQWLTTNLRPGAKPVAITIRDAGYSPARNSNIEAFAAFAIRLDKNNYAPFFVPDTDTALLGSPAPLAGFPWFAEASFNIGLRMAVYELAYLNVLSSGGASALCMFNPAVRYIYLKQIVDGAPEASEAHLRSFGHIPGANLPFAEKHQKWIWEDDRLDVIEREFAAMAAVIEVEE